MSTFTKYLTEAAKSYDYKIKVAGDIDKDFATRMETCLQKFEVAKMSAIEYEQNEETIRKAIQSGKFVYDVSGAARA